MGLREILGHAFGHAQPPPVASPSAPPAPVHPQMPAAVPAHMLPGTGASAGYMQSGNGHPMMGTSAPQSHEDPHRVGHALKSMVHNSAEGAAQANAMMQKDAGQSYGGVTWAAQPHLYEALARAYRGQGR